MRRIPFLVIMVVCLSMLAYAGLFIFSEYSAMPANNQVTVSWVTKSETGINKFLIMRSSDDKFFSEVGSRLARGSAGSYSFTDENVIFKEQQTFFYKIRAVKSDNSVVEETESLIVNPNISGIFRTWGAIKAMFR
jgi:hypothetical protein